MSEFALVVDGDQYTGWTEVRVTRALDQFAHSFEFTYSDRWTTEDRPRPLSPGAAVTVQYGTDRLITGWLDHVRTSIGPEGVTATAAGRSLTGDLADCSAIHKTGQWRNQTATNIIKELCEPFGVAVSTDESDSTQIVRFDLESGETVYDAVSRLARLRAWLPITTSTGNIRLIRSGSGAVVQLDAARAIRREVEISTQDRFGTYRILTQTARTSADEFDGDPRRSALEKYETTDPFVSRYRPLVVQSETGSTVQELKDHCTWERNTRAAQSERIIYELPGVTDDDGKPWEPATLITVDDPVQGISGTYLCCSVQHTVNDQQVSTEIQLTRPEAYSIEPLPNKELTKKLRKI